MKDKVLDLLDNKDNWDTSKDGDKITFKLKENWWIKTEKLKKNMLKYLSIEKN